LANRHIRGRNLHVWDASGSRCGGSKEVGATHGASEGRGGRGAAGGGGFTTSQRTLAERETGINAVGKNKIMQAPRTRGRQGGKVLGAQTRDAEGGGVKEGHVAHRKLRGLGGGVSSAQTANSASTQVKGNFSVRLVIRRQAMGKRMCDKERGRSKGAYMKPRGN